MNPSDNQVLPPPAEPPPVPVWPVRPVRPPLKTWVTILCSVATGLSAVIILVASFFGSPFEYMEDPETLIIAIAEKDLDIDAALQTLSVWEQTLVRLLGYSAEDNLQEIGGAYKRAIEYAKEPHASLRARRLILEAEQGNESQLDDAVDQLPVTESSEVFLDAVLYAYLGETPRSDPGENGWDLSILETGNSRIDQTAWSRERLLARLAQRDGQDMEARRLDQATVYRGQQSVRRARLIEAVYLLTVLSGLMVAAWWITRSPRSTAIANGMVVAPWSLRYGAAVIVRCVAASTAVLFLIALVSGFASWFPLGQMYTLFMFVPMVFIIHHYLFRPEDSNLFKGFGMWPGTVSWKGMVLFALALTAVDQVGCLVIENGARWVGLPMIWEEGLDETILLGPLHLALLSTVDGAIWAPLFEEIAFRGLLYITLRTRMTPLPAAAISAGLFGIVHLYSVVGFLEVTWTGFVLAVGYEKCRSLWPCIFAHFFNNLFYFAVLLLVYR